MTKKLYYFNSQYVANLSTLLFALLITINLSASDWNLLWITCPQADSVSQVQYRHTYVFDGCPETGKISIASSGRHILFVNGYNVSVNVIEPGVSPVGNAVSMVTYDVTRYLKADSNIVAVWSSPVPPCRAGAKGMALAFYGLDAYGRRYSYRADDSWICRQSGSCTMPSGTEACDAQLADVDWHSSDFKYPVWQGAEISGKVSSVDGIRQRIPFYTVPLWHTVLRPVHIYGYKYFDVDGRHIVYRFPHTFNGWVRVTFRGMSSGAEVVANGLRYRCNGDIDEQACRRFTTTWQNSADIMLPPDASVDNIQNVEGIEIAPCLYTGWKY